MHAHSEFVAVRGFYCICITMLCNAFEDVVVKYRNLKSFVRFTHFKGKFWKTKQNSHFCELLWQT